MLNHSSVSLVITQLKPLEQLYIKKISESKADKRYVIVLSVADFLNYGIKPTDFSNLLLSNPLVNVYAIFIGSLGDQATR